MNRIKARWRNACKRADEYQVENTLTFNEWFLLLVESDGKCFYCDVQCGIESLSPDHAIPLTEGGGNTMDNIVPSCVSCNLSKNKFALPKIPQALWEPKHYIQQIAFCEFMARREMKLANYYTELINEGLEIPQPLPYPEA